MTNEEIEKLRKKVAKNPQSALLIPLAEEYKKRGMIYEAIDVLNKAIKNRPAYTSARVSLGKIYLNKGMFQEAREEFEKVVSIIPDNLFAHKRLVVIYHQQEEFQLARKECEIVLKLNPNDEDAISMILTLTPPEKETKASPALPPDTRSHKKLLSHSTINTLLDSQKTAADKDTKSPREKKIKAAPVYEIHEKVSCVDLGIEIPDKLTPVSEDTVSNELKEFRKVMAEHAEKSAGTENGREQSEGKHSTPDSLSNAEEPSDNIKDKAGPLSKSSDKIVISMSTGTMADIFVTQGQYDKAMNVYKELLSSDPGNDKIIQKCKELEMLIKIKENKPH